MRGEQRLTGIARIIGLLVALALLLSLILPLAGVAAQESDQPDSKIALSEVPTTGARRPGPVVLAGTRVRVEKPAGFVPVELQVDSIGLDAPIETGYIDNGVMRDPSGPWVVSWYAPLGKVGEGGNVVMAGHVDYWDVGPAIFQGVPSLQPGDILRIIGENGEVMEYAVEWSRLFDVANELTPEVIQRDIVGDTGQETLTLITCGGDFNGQEYLQRWVLRADKI
ncbi:MAG: class F sortase [Thermomicrobiales bacterium]